MEKKPKNLDTFIKFSPAIVAVIAFIITYKIVATPADVHTEFNKLDSEISTRIDKLESKISNTYATKEETKNLQRQYDNISVKIDRIYDYIITAKR